MSLTIETSVELAIAHRLVEHHGKCRRLHGHNYTFTVEAQRATSRGEGGLDDQGMIMDFAQLKRMLQDTIVIPFDHKTLVSVPDNEELLHSGKPYCFVGDDEVHIPFQSTAERLLLLFVALVDAVLHTDDCRVLKATLSETANCRAIYRHGKA